MNEVQEVLEIPEVVKTAKNPKRVSAGKKGAEAKKIKVALKRKELEEIKEENIRLKNIEPKESITKDEVPEVLEVPEVPIKIIKNYIPLCFVIGVTGLGLGFYFFKPREVIKNPIPVKKEKEIDPFEF